jgi:hypothetical protein
MSMLFKITKLIEIHDCQIAVSNQPMNNDIDIRIGYIRYIIKSEALAIWSTGDRCRISVKTVTWVGLENLNQIRIIIKIQFHLGLYIYK